MIWKALNATGRPILYNLCNWAEDYVHTWGMSIANSRRISGDIYDFFIDPTICVATQTRQVPTVSLQAVTAPFSTSSTRPLSTLTEASIADGMDMLEVGLGDMTDEEYEAHFSMWAALKSPLLIGADLRELSAQTLSILNNPAVIAVNQDSLSKLAHRISWNLNVPKDKYGQGETQVWSRPLYPSDQIVVFLNAADEDVEMSVTFDDIFASDGPGVQRRGQKNGGMYTTSGQKGWTRQPSMSLKTAIVRQEFQKANWYNSTKLPYAEGFEGRQQEIAWTADRQD
jgi:alpha-galactosidase